MSLPVAATSPFDRAKLSTVQVTLKKQFFFEAAHFLPAVPAGHKCSRMHGHSYRVEVELVGPVDPATGWLVDFAVIDESWAVLQQRFDHHVLNEVQGLENPTCENLSVYIAEVMSKRVPHFAAVTVWETTDACCTFRS